MKGYRRTTSSDCVGQALAVAIGAVLCMRPVAVSGAEAAAATESTVGDPVKLQNRSIAYVLTERLEAIYQAKDKDGKETREECPQGLYDTGPREQFATRFTKSDGKKLKFTDTVLRVESSVWFPDTEPDKFPFREAAGKFSYGLNLDGKTKPSDFTSPDGKTEGIDNQFYRAVGCIPSYREGSSQRLFYDEYIELKQFNRTIIAITDVDDLSNDDNVTITTYRGLDPLIKDALGHFQPGTTQRLDLVWGKAFIHKFKGKIVNGVLLTTKSGNFVWPNENHTDASTEMMHDAQFQLHLTPDHVEGLIGGYVDVESAYRAIIKRYGSHQISYGKLSAPSLYKVLRRLADAYPDPKTGENTAISSALTVSGVRVYLLGDSSQVALAQGERSVKR